MVILTILGWAVFFACVYCTSHVWFKRGTFARIESLAVAVQSTREGLLAYRTMAEVFKAQYIGQKASALNTLAELASERPVSAKVAVSDRARREELLKMVQQSDTMLRDMDAYVAEVGSVTKGLVESHYSVTETMLNRLESHTYTTRDLTDEGDIGWFVSFVFVVDHQVRELQRDLRKYLQVCGTLYCVLVLSYVVLGAVGSLPYGVVSGMLGSHLHSGGVAANVGQVSQIGVVSCFPFGMWFIRFVVVCWVIDLEGVERRLGNRRSALGQVGDRVNVV